MWISSASSAGPASSSSTRVAGILGQARGQDAAGATGTDDDVVVHGHLLNHSSGCRRQPYRRVRPCARPLSGPPPAHSRGRVNRRPGRPASPVPRAAHGPAAHGCAPGRWPGAHPSTLPATVVSGGPPRSAGRGSRQASSLAPSLVTLRSYTMPHRGRNVNTPGQAIDHIVDSAVFGTRRQRTAAAPALPATVMPCQTIAGTSPSCCPASTPAPVTTAPPRWATQPGRQDRPAAGRLRRRGRGQLRDRDRAHARRAARPDVVAAAGPGPERAVRRRRRPVQPGERQPAPIPRCGSTTAYISALERDCDEYNEDLPTLRSFVLPGGTAGAALLHTARTVVRRAERSTWAALAEPRRHDEPAHRPVPEPALRPAVHPRPAGERPSTATCSGSPAATGRHDARPADHPPLTVSSGH